MLNLVKWEALAIANKRSPVVFTYCINHQPVKWTNLSKYLGVYINSKLTWSNQCQATTAKVMRVLNVLRQNMVGCSSEAKCRAYKAIVRPIMEYACTVWSPYTAKDISLLEAVQKRALRWACGSRWDPSALSWTIPHNVCHKLLNVPRLCDRWNFISVCLLRDIRHESVAIPYYKYNTLPTKSHYLTLIPASSTINARRHSYFVRTCFLWNNVPLSALDIDRRAAFRHALCNYFCLVKWNEHCI